ncbi:MAG: hypothetical protein ACYSXF_06385, partial [Planctomycetota bacterium]
MTRLARPSPQTVAVPSEMWRMLSARSSQQRKLPKGLDAVWNAASGRVVAVVPRQRRYLTKAEAVLALEKEYAGLNTYQLRGEAARLRDVFRLGRAGHDELCHAFAIVREVGHRTVGLKLYPEQVAAAFVLHDACVAEMATGEGKTLAATPAAAVAGWRGRGCHVITVNDYLAGRDRRTMEPIYQFGGLTVAH